MAKPSGGTTFGHNLYGRTRPAVPRRMTRWNASVVALVPFLAAAAGAAQPGEPFVIVLDWEGGHFGVGAPVVGGSGVNEAEWPVWVDACHRRLFVDLLYEPDNATAALGNTSVKVPFEFAVELAAPEWSLTARVRNSGHGHFLGEAPEAADALLTLRLERGFGVDWSVRLRGWEARDEPACITRVLLNEVEANPAGTDAGNEWVELHNPGTFDVDLGGWMLESTHGVIERWVLPAGTVVARGGHVQVVLPGQFLDNEDEAVRLLQPGGVVADETPPRSDTANDERSWQRVPDGSDAWVFAVATPGAPNAG